MQHRFLNALIAIAFIIVTLALTHMFDRMSTPLTGGAQQDLGIVQNNSIVPDITLTTLDGKTIRLHDYKGKVVLLNFWASWCAPCIVEFPQFIRLAQTIGDDVVILAVSTDDNRANIEKFLKRVKFKQAPNMMIAWDADKKISQDVFGTIRLPETVIIDPALRMKDKIVGLPFAWDSRSEEKLKKIALYK